MIEQINLNINTFAEFKTGADTYYILYAEESFISIYGTNLLQSRQSEIGEGIEHRREIKMNRQISMLTLAVMLAFTGVLRHQGIGDKP